jgi:ribonuclease HII
MKGRQVSLTPGLVLGVQPGELEEEGFSLGFKSVAGLDEVGRGPLAGPVMAAAVIFPRGFVHPEITDSKLLTPKKREALVPLIKGNALAWGVGSAEPHEIDRINILQASLLAMARALQQMVLEPDYLLIDGIHTIPHSYLVPLMTRESQTSKAKHKSSVSRSSSNEPMTNGLPCQKTVKHGDRLCLSIAAASILAKVTRDRLMADYDLRYPEYGFAGHKGYGCASHLRALQQYGPSPIHRKSFRPVRESLMPEGSDQQSTLGLVPPLTTANGKR